MIPARKDRPLRFLSALKSEQVLDNLRAREREWRESAIPPELRTLGVTGLDVQLGENSFAMQWTGNVSLLYNLALKGVIEDTQTGSEISAGFGAMPVSMVVIAYLLILSLQIVVSPRAIYALALAILLGVLLIPLALHGRGRSGIFKSHLIAVLNKALQKP